MSEQESPSENNSLVAQPDAATNNPNSFQTTTNAAYIARSAPDRARHLCEAANWLDADHPDNTYAATLRELVRYIDDLEVKAAGFPQPQADLGQVDFLATSIRAGINGTTVKHLIPGVEVAALLMFPRLVGPYATDEQLADAADQAWRFAEALSDARNRKYGLTEQKAVPA